MRWEDSEWIRSYIPPRWDDWYKLSLEARGLWDELLKVLDRCGMMRVGSDVVFSVCQAVNGHPDRVPAYLQELFADGCLVYVRNDDGTGMLVSRNYIDAQTAKPSDRLRRAHYRRQQRDRVLGTHYENPQQSLFCNVANEMSRIYGTGCHVEIFEKREREKPGSSPSVKGVGQELPAPTAADIREVVNRLSGTSTSGETVDLEARRQLLAAQADELRRRGR